ncbi:hypothetical protein [Parafrankia soli]
MTTAPFDQLRGIQLQLVGTELYGHFGLAPYLSSRPSDRQQS